MIRLFVCSILLLAAAGAIAEDTLVIDDFEYADAAAAGQGLAARPRDPRRCRSCLARPR
jgi:hypothetical protein